MATGGTIRAYESPKGRLWAGGYVIVDDENYQFYEVTLWGTPGGTLVLTKQRRGFGGARQLGLAFALESHTRLRGEIKEDEGYRRLQWDDPRLGIKEALAREFGPLD